jgi:hypothetical protein
MVDAADGSPAAEHAVLVVQHAIRGQYLPVQVGRAVGARSGVFLRPRTDVSRRRPVSSCLLAPLAAFSVVPLEVRAVCPQRPLQDMGREHAFRGAAHPFGWHPFGWLSGGHPVGCPLDVQRAFTW